MRAPARTRAQRQHAREQRAVLALRSAAVRYSVLTDGEAAAADVALAFADLTIASDKYAATLTARERAKLIRRGRR